MDPRHGAYYTNLSGWDIYRTQAQLEALLDPSVAGDVAQSMVDVYHQSGRLPKWIEDNSEAYIMVGDPADSILADYYAFGVRNFNTGEALTAMVHDATKTSQHPARRALPGPARLPARERQLRLLQLLRPGVQHPGVQHGRLRAVGVRRRAGQLAPTSTSSLDRAQDWWNMLNPNSGFDQPREANGTFAGKFSPASAPLVAAHGFVEGDSWIYTGMVPFNVAGLTAAKGGDAAFATYLNTVLSSYKNANGYAYVGNEPSIELPWEYDYIGQP